MARDMTREMEILLTIEEIIKRAKEQHHTNKNWSLTIKHPVGKDLTIHTSEFHIQPAATDSKKAESVCYQTILTALEVYKDAIKKDMKANII